MNCSLVQEYERTRMDIAGLDAQRRLGGRKARGAVSCVDCGVNIRSLWVVFVWFLPSFPTSHHIKNAVLWLQYVGIRRGRCAICSS